MSKCHHAALAQTFRRVTQERLRALSKRYGIHQKTVAKWKKRTSV
ncbi:IS481 family transposase, partial [Xanthomonas vasicola]